MCLDFINTLDDRFSGEPNELLKTYIDLARFGEDTLILPTEQVDRLFTRSQESPDLAQRALQSAKQLREAMSQIFYAVARRKPVPRGAVILLNGFVQEAAQHASLTPARRHFEWEFDSAASDFDAPLWPIARSAADLLASDQLQLVRACASKTCEWLFLDTSKAHKRRWCDMTKCGNRAKARRHYSRQSS